MPKHTFIQRLARATFVGLCAAMAIGVSGAVSVRAMDRDETVTAAAPAHAHANVGLAYEWATSPLATERSSTKATPRPKAGSRIVRMEVTGYCPCKKCCGPEARGITASGKRVSYDRGRFVAADTRVLPFGTKLSVPGYHGGRAVEVIDRGGAIKGKKLDLYFPTHEAALQWGRRHVDVTVYAD
jgi:3D (Asp-Asp-Asp) domain-containing protein